MCLQILYLMYMSKKDLALNNQQMLICHKTQPNQVIYNEAQRLCVCLYIYRTKGHRKVCILM